MNSILSLFSFFILAAETIISPLSLYAVNKPLKTFGMISESVNILGISDSETPSDNKPTKKVKIALLGDSMIDTLGPDFPALKQILKDTYPHVEADILNYGVGGTNIDYGIERITSDYEYLGNKISSLASQQPDIVIIESFGYNPYPFDTGALDTHWLALAKAVDTVKQTIPNAKIIIAATIAPNETIFTQGALGLNFTPEERKTKTTIIKSYLESTIRFANGEKLPLADAYTASLTNTGTGNSVFINPGDNIHPSDEGKMLFAQAILATIQHHTMIE